MTPKNFLFIHYGYRGRQRQPHLTLQPEDGNVFEHLALTGKTLTLRFDAAKRFCTGWHDLAQGESFACPNSAPLPAQFTQCRHCQNKTGFNPAFYHAASVSPQQQQRNAQPHFLYIAHFAPGVLKVGISWAQREIARLLDQGARSALVLKTYPSAVQARQYEAKIAALPGIAETLQASAKRKLLSLPYDETQAAQELLEVRRRVIEQIGLTPDDNQPFHLDAYYVRAPFEPHNFVHLDDAMISGRCIGMIGAMLLMAQDGQQYGLSLQRFVGYKVTVSDEEVANVAVPQQGRLF